MPSVLRRKSAVLNLGVGLLARRSQTRRIFWRQLRVAPPSPAEAEWVFEATCPRSQWRDRAGLAPDFPVMPLVGTQRRRLLYHATGAGGTRKTVMVFASVTPSAGYGLQAPGYGLEGSLPKSDLVRSCPWLGLRFRLRRATGCRLRATGLEGSLPKSDLVRSCPWLGLRFRLRRATGCRLRATAWRAVFRNRILSDLVRGSVFGFAFGRLRAAGSGLRPGGQSFRNRILSDLVRGSVFGFAFGGLRAAGSGLRPGGQSSEIGSCQILSVARSSVSPSAGYGLQAPGYGPGGQSSEIGSCQILSVARSSAGSVSAAPRSAAATGCRLRATGLEGSLPKSDLVRSCPWLRPGISNG